MAAVIYMAGALVCHQIPERSLHAAGVQLPVCARCLGIYAGALLGMAVLAWADGGRARGRPGAGWLVAAAGPTAAGVALEAAGVLETSNAVRVVAGGILGLGVSAVVMWAGATLHYRECPPEDRRHAGTT